MVTCAGGRCHMAHAFSWSLSHFVTPLTWGRILLSKWALETIESYGRHGSCENWVSPYVRGGRICFHVGPSSHYTSTLFHAVHKASPLWRKSVPQCPRELYFTHKFTLSGALADIDTPFVREGVKWLFGYFRVFSMNIHHESISKWWIFYPFWQLIHCISHTSFVRLRPRSFLFYSFRIHN